MEESLGFYPVRVVNSVIDEVTEFSRYVMFIGIIFDLVVALLVIMSVMLIYSLLVINVETKTFHIGVQRMVGLTRRGLILMVIIQSLMFVLPALISAFLVGYPVLMIF
jgi:ABC-type antimicrobial peptide transport system permease subunit